MILPDETDPARFAGSVVIWSHAEDHDRAEHSGGAVLAEPISEFGWMVLPDFQVEGRSGRLRPAISCCPVPALVRTQLLRQGSRENVPPTRIASP